MFVHPPEYWKALKVFSMEMEQTLKPYPQEVRDGVFRAALLLLFGNYVDGATTFAENCGGGGSTPDSDWGRDKDENDALWARRCFRKAFEMVTTPRRRGLRR